MDEDDERYFEWLEELEQRHGAAREWDDPQGTP